MLGLLKNRSHAGNGLAEEKTEDEIPQLGERVLRERA
jgi:hypothetical protein